MNLCKARNGMKWCYTGQHFRPVAEFAMGDPSRKHGSRYPNCKGCREMLRQARSAAFHPELVEP